MEPTQPLPESILEQLRFHCEANDMGLVQIGHTEIGVHMILMGKRSLSPDQGAIIAAEMLLHGVVSGALNHLNKEMVNANENREENKLQ